MLSLLFFSIRAASTPSSLSVRNSTRDCVLELPLLSLDLASPAQLLPHAPDHATAGLALTNRLGSIPSLLLASTCVDCGARSREPANGGRRLSVSIGPPPDPPCCAMGWAPCS
ncbi:hypothetical protein VPH35_036739 [Triticum aestivum]